MRIVRSVAGLGAMMLLLAACGGAESDAGSAADAGSAQGESSDDGSYEERQFTVGVGVGDSHAFYKGGVEFFQKELEERSDGALTMEVFPEGQLGGLPESLQMMESGTADMTLAVVSYQTNELPLNQAWVLPRGLTGPEAMHAMWNGYHADGVLKEELRSSGCVPLAVSSTDSYELFMAGTKPTGHEALGGALIRVAGPVMEQTFTRAGASPVEMTVTEQYEAMQRGSLDGTAVHPSQAVVNGIHEVADYATQGGDVFISPGNLLCIAESVWNELGEEERQLLYEVGREATIEIQRHFEEQGEAAYDTFREAGVEIVEWDDEATEAYQESISGIDEWWLDSVEDPDAEAAVNEVDQAVQEARNAEDIWDLSDPGPWE